MGLSGQTLFANSDGTISVDGSLLTIQGQPVQLAGHVPSTAFGYASFLVCLFTARFFILCGSVLTALLLATSPNSAFLLPLLQVVSISG